MSQKNFLERPTFFRGISLIVGVLTMSVIISFAVLAAWTDAPANPPDNNVDKPLNIGLNDQIKSGGLSVGAFISKYGTILAKDSGNVGIGTTNPGAKLDVQGGNLNVGSATIKGDGSLSTGLNAEKVGGYTATELMASAKLQGCNDCDNDKHVSYSYCFNNDCSLHGDDCDDNNPAIVGGSVSYYCDQDGDGFISSSPYGTTCGSAPSGCTTTLGIDCNDNDNDIYPGHASKSSTDSKDNNCNGQVDECSSTVTVCDSSGTFYYVGSGSGCDASSPQCCDGCVSSCSAPYNSVCWQGGVCRGHSVGGSCCLSSHTVCNGWN